jgi:hypothetical protein
MTRLQSLCVRSHGNIRIASSLPHDLLRLLRKEEQQEFDWILSATSTSDDNNTVQKQLFVHGAVIASRSEYMRSLLLFEKTETKSNQRSLQNVITLNEGVNVSAYDCIIKYLYTGDCEIEVNNAVEVLQLAHQYCLSELQMRCEYDTSAMIDRDNVCFLLEFSDFYDMPILYAACIKYINEHATEIQNKKDYQDMIRRAPLLADKIKQGNKSMTKRKQEHYQYKTKQDPKQDKTE